MNAEFMNMLFLVWESVIVQSADKEEKEFD
jgi:hypothetical protein